MKKLSVLFVAFVLLSCKQQLSDHDVVLQIGDFEVTNYTLNKKVHRMFPYDYMKNQKALEDFKKEFINSYYIIADAYQNGYDTLKHIQHKLKHNKNRAMTEHRGQLWNKLVSERLYDSIQITPARIEKRSKLFYFDIIGIGNKELFLELVDNDTILDSVDEFLGLKKQCSDHLFLNNTSATIQWPFSDLYAHANILYTMESGQVSQLINSGTSSFYLYLDHTETIEMTTEEEDKFRFELQQIAEKQIYEEKDLQMLASGNPVLNEESIKNLMTFVNEGNELKFYPKNPPVIEYMLDGELKTVHFKEYITPILEYPMYLHIENEQQLRETILESFFTDYMVQEARELGLFEDELFALDCKSLLNSYVYYEYIDKEIRKTIEIDSTDVFEYYTENQKHFTKPETLIFNCYFFEDEHTALCNWQAITDFYRHNNSETIMSSKHLYNLNSVLPKHKINVHNTHIADQSLINELRSIEPGNLSQAIPYMGKFALLYRAGQEGEIVMDLNDVYGNIESILTSERTLFLLNERYNHLKEKYPLVKEKIDINKLL